MKKYITIAAFLVAGTAFANAVTPVEVTTDYTIDSSTPKDARLDIKYNADPAVLKHTITTTVDNAEIYGFDGYALNTAGKELTLSIQYNLNFTSDGGKFSTGGTFSMDINTALNESELASFVAGDSVRRIVLSSDKFGGPARTYFSDIAVTSLDSYNLIDGGLIYALNKTVEGVDTWTYYSADDVSFSGDYVSVSSSASAITLAEGTAYTFARITATSGASVKGYGFVATIPEPSAFGLLAGLGALALVGARRRRK